MGEWVAGHVSRQNIFLLYVVKRPIKLVLINVSYRSIDGIFSMSIKALYGSKVRSCKFNFVNPFVYFVYKSKKIICHYFSLITSLMVRSATLALLSVI